jgi:type VI secretion system protein ImpH
MSAVQPPHPERILPPVETPIRWGSGKSLLDRLFAEGSRFNFYQAVRILSLSYRGSRAGLTHGSVPVRFRSQMDFDFPGSDVEHIAKPEREELPEMLVNFLGLAGAHGPLPAAYTERLLEEPRVPKGVKPKRGRGKRLRNSALRDFLDIFNHRLILLLYRVHEMHHPELTAGSPDQGLAANHLFTFFGLGRRPDSAARGRLWVADRSLLYYSGIFAHRPHSASGLQRLLSDYFQVPVAVEEFVGAWLRLSEDQWTRIGTRQGCNQRLGDGAILGKRIWDQHARVTIRLGPLDLSTFEGFLPGRVAYKPLQDLTRFYLGDEVNFSFKLVLRSREVPGVAPFDVGSSGPGIRQVELGRLAWLKGDKSASSASEPDVFQRDGVALIDGEL